MRGKAWLVAGLLAVVSSYSYFFPRAPRVEPLARLEAAPLPTIVFAPHSDDEVLAAGGLLQQLQREGAKPQVVLVTAGDGFRLGAEAQFRRGRVHPETMLQYGEHRLTESKAALSALGVPANQFSFLGFPDQGLHRLWLECWDPAQPCTSLTTNASRVPYQEALHAGAPYAGATLLDEIIDVLRQARPAVVVYPHPNEAHVDHWALSNFVEAALEELRRTEPDWTPPEEWYYLVHRGDWPAPKGYRPTEGLVPPAAMTGGMTVWRQHPLSADEVTHKDAAVHAYHSQTMLLKRYMESFIRTNELFGSIDRIKLVDGADMLPSYSNERPPWQDLRWAQVITDPRADTVAREVERGADTTGVWVARSGGMLYMAAPMAAKPRSPVDIHFYARTFRSGRGWSDLIAMTVTPDGGHTIDSWPVQTGRDRIESKISGNWVRAAIPLDVLWAPESVMLSVETRVDEVLVDRTAWRPVSLDGR